MSGRNTNLDSLKFFLIFLVIVGHCLDIGLYAKFNNDLFRLIYSFHMPVFVILSGMVFRYKSLKELFWGGILLLTSYLLFQLLYGGKTLSYTEGSVLEFWIKGVIYNAKHLYDPSDGLWYILSLLFWRLFLNSTPESIIKRKFLHIGLLLAVSLIAGFIPLGRVLSFQRTFAFYPYFVLGYYLKDNYCMMRSIPKVIPVGVIIIYALIIILTEIPQISPLLQRMPYVLSSLETSISNRCFFYIWTLPITLSIISLFPDVKYFSKEGQYTLFYYLYHMFFVLAFRCIVIHFGVECNVLTVFTFSVISLLVMGMMRRKQFFVFLSSPFSFVKTK